MPARKPELENTPEEEGFDSDHADMGEWDRVATGIGDKIEWTPGTVFEGIYNGITVVEDVVGLNGETGPADAHTFTDTVGDDCFAWSTYQLDQALKGNEGKMVRIVHLGKKNINNGAQTLNQFKVYTKKAGK